MSGRSRPLLRIALPAFLALTAAAPAGALPTMVRLGYASCTSCHIAPQGGGPLNEYGRGIDEAQSLRAGEYKPADAGTGGVLNLWGRVTQDVRTVIQHQQAWATDRSVANLFRPRLMYRNVTELGKGFRVSALLSAETEHVQRPALGYDPPSLASSVFVGTALVHYRLGGAAEIAVGRDQLPSGINLPDPGLAIKARNRLGYYDVPTQVKLFVTGKRYQVAPFVYAPGGNDPMGEAERGAGALAELDVFGKGRTVVGFSVARGVADNGDRRVMGMYTRLGFGSWGILAEHDVTDRTRPVQTLTPFRQQATYGQMFWAIREWLVASAIGERLTVQQPFEERFAAGKLELNARLTGQATVGVSARRQRSLLTNHVSTSFMVQAAFKTVR
jgi:hypothetical protein